MERRKADIDYLDVHADRRLNAFEAGALAEAFTALEGRSSKSFENRAKWLNDQNNLLVQKKLDAQASTVRQLLERVDGKLQNVERTQTQFMEVANGNNDPAQHQKAKVEREALRE